MELRPGDTVYKVCDRYTVTDFEVQSNTVDRITEQFVWLKDGGKSAFEFTRRFYKEMHRFWYKTPLDALRAFERGIEESIDQSLEEIDTMRKRLTRVGKAIKKEKKTKRT
jgi:hypothetical protein